MPSPTASTRAGSQDWLNKGRHSRESGNPASVAWAPASAGATEIRSVPEIVELQRDIGNGFPHQRDGFLQHAPLGAGNAHRLALDAGLRLELAVLDDLDAF